MGTPDQQVMWQAQRAMENSVSFLSESLHGWECKDNH